MIHISTMIAITYASSLLHLFSSLTPSLTPSYSFCHFMYTGIICKAAFKRSNNEMVGNPNTYTSNGFQQLSSFFLPLDTPLFFQFFLISSRRWRFPALASHISYSLGVGLQCFHNSSSFKFWVFMINNVWTLTYISDERSDPDCYLNLMKIEVKGSKSFGFIAQ